MADESTTSKACRVCSMQVPLENFPINKQARDGHSGICKDCYKGIVERRRNRRRERNESNPEMFKRSVQNYLWKLSKRRATEKGLTHSIKPSDIEVVDECPILKIPLNKFRGGFDRSSYSLDRVDSSIGYEPGNVRVISWRANAVKSSLTVDEVKRLLEYMTQHKERES